MRLTIVGCSGSFPGPDSAASCYLVEAPYEGRTFREFFHLPRPLSVYAAPAAPDAGEQA